MCVCVCILAERLLPLGAPTYIHAPLRVLMIRKLLPLWAEEESPPPTFTPLCVSLMIRRLLPLGAEEEAPRGPVSRPPRRRPAASSSGHDRRWALGQWKA